MISSKLIFDIESKIYQTSIHCAAEGGHDEILRLLLKQKNVNYNIKNWVLSIT